MRKYSLFFVDVAFCLKILTLHGGGGSGVSMRNAISDIRATLGPDITYVHATTPESNGVWFQDPPGGKKQPTTDLNWANNAIVYLDDIISNNGPFDGIMGYSQGSAMTILYTSMHPDIFRFVVTFCGYLPETHLGLMNTITAASKLNISSLFYMSTLDTIITNTQTQAASEVFLNPNIIIDVGVGGHQPPSSGSSLQSVVQFINTFLPSPSLPPVASLTPISSSLPPVSSLMSPPTSPPPISFNLPPISSPIIPSLAPILSPSLPHPSLPNNPNDELSHISFIAYIIGLVLVIISSVLYYSS